MIILSSCGFFLWLGWKTVLLFGARSAIFWYKYSYRSVLKNFYSTVSPGLKYKSQFPIKRRPVWQRKLFAIK